MTEQPLTAAEPDEQIAVPQRTAPLVERPHPLTPLVRGWLILVAIIWGFGREFLPGGPGQGFRVPPLNWLSAGVVAVIVLASTVSYIEWRNTRFVVDDDELRIETGAFTRTSQRIRVDRIQSVDITQPVAARLFGLAELQIDVGAEGGTRLRYLTRQRAGALRDHLLLRAQGVGASLATSEAAPSSSGYDDLSADDEPLIRARPERLVVGALLSNEMLLIVLPPLAVFAVGYFGDQAFGAGFSENPWLIVGLAIPVLGTLANLISRRVVGQWNYTLARSGDRLKITRGLTSLTSQSVPRKRVQALRVSQPLAWRPLGLYRIDLAILGLHGVTTDEDQAGASSILLPVGSRDDVRTAIAAIWPDVDLDALTIIPTPRRTRWLNPLAYRWLGFGYDESVILTRTGWANRIESVVPHARLQSWALTQGPVQRRLDLSHIELHPSGQLWGIAAKDVEGAIARDFVLTQADRGRAGLAGTPAAPVTPEVA